MRDVELDRCVLGLQSTGRTTMFASTPSTCTRRTLDLPRLGYQVLTLFGKLGYSHFNCPTDHFGYISFAPHAQQLVGEWAYCSTTRTVLSAT